jgi:hypothetical protein
MSPEIRYNCPFCVLSGKSQDTKGHLYANTKRKVYYCHRCGATGPIKNLPGHILHSPMGVEGRTVIPPFITAPMQEDNSIPISMMEEGKLKEMVFMYLMQRGVSRFNTDTLRLRYYPDHNAILFPVYGVPGGRPLWYQEKPFGGKYLFPKNTPEISYTVFRTFGIPIIGAKQNCIVVCEGVFDAIRAGQASGTGAVALFGKNPPDGRLMAIGMLTDKAIVLLDQDAFEEAVMLVLRLRRIGVRAKMADPSGLHGDPGATNTATLSTIINKVKEESWCE